jgi:CRISPR-associated protein Csd1
MNCLLADVNQHLSIGPVIYIFWVTQETEFNPFLFLDKPDPKLVRELLMTYLTAKRITIEDDTKFNMLSMTSSGGSRVAFRDWLHTSLGSVKNTIATWFSQLSIVDEYGRDAKPLGIWSLTRGLYPDHLQYRQVQEQMKKNPLFPQVLAHCALHGAPLPKSLLAQAVNRCRAEQDVTYPRAALIKAVLCSNIGKKEDMMTGLNLEERRPGYVCGRLLAVLDEIQYSALGKINATLVDRFYGSASTAPASVFGTLISHAQPHLAKIRKNPKKKGHSEALKERLEEVLLKLESFPKTLAIQDQALFALGYYHQRAASRDATNRAISDRKAEHDAQDTMTEEDTTDVE